MTDAAGRTGPEPTLSADVLNQVEGYLLWQARVAEAEQRARVFTEPLQWLTTAQREEIERHYIRDCLTRARVDLHRIAQRTRGIRGEYEKRYRQLRMRCVAWFVTAVATMTAAAALTVATVAHTRP
jgi:hypothetical protein